MERASRSHLRCSGGACTRAGACIRACTRTHACTDACTRACTYARARNYRRRLTRFVGGKKVIRRSVAQRIEESGATMGVPPALGVNALDVVTHVEEVRPRLHRYLG